MVPGDLVIGRQSSKFINPKILSLYPIEELTAWFPTWRRDEGGRATPYEYLPSGIMLSVIEIESVEEGLSTGPKVKVMAPTGGIYWVLGCNLEPLEAIDEAR